LHSASDVRDIEVGTSESIPIEVEIAIAELIWYTMSSRYQIPAEPIQEGGTLLSAIHKLINSIWNREQLSDQWQSIVAPVYKGDENGSHIYRRTSLVMVMVVVVATDHANTIIRSGFMFLVLC
jgi:hypothetical protein